MNLSIVIPTYNERHYLGATIERIRVQAATSDIEIVVVDCGSTDATVALARSLGVAVIRNPELRGSKWRSLNAGAAASDGDALLFLDADSLVPPAFDRHIRKILATPGVVGGAFEHAFHESTPGLTAISWINRIRYRIRCRFYGDQGIFTTREAWELSGGWPPLAIMEAAHFCKALQRHGRLRIAPCAVATSPRRFTEGGVYRVFARDILIWFLDFVGRDVQRFAGRYWEENHQRGATGG